jgi:hypothetical protein
LAAALEQLPERVNVQERPLAAKPKGKKIDSALRESLYRKLGVDLTRLPLLGQRKEWRRLFCWGFDTVRVKGRHYIGPGFSWLWAC